MSVTRVTVGSAILLTALCMAATVGASGTNLDDAMLPTETEAGLEFREPPATNLSETGEVTSVTATYKAPPAPGEPTDPRDVCEGAGWGGADAGFGPNLCLTVSLVQPDAPCPECYEPTEVRRRFPLYPGTSSEQAAPDPCQLLTAAPGTPPAWPCVDGTTVLPLGAEVSGFEQLDRNVHMTRFRLIGEVDGISVSIAARYLTYAVDGADLDYMATQVRSLGEVVETTIRRQFADGAGAGDENAPGTGDAAAPPAFPTTNDEPVDHVAPVAVIGALAAIAAVVTTIGAVGAAAGSSASSGAGPPPEAPPIEPGSFVDPDTGEPLPVETGKVWYGDWMPPDVAQQLIDQRIDELELDAQAAAKHQQFVTAQQAIRDDQMASQGFIHDPDSNTWVPGEHTQDILDQQWQDKMADDPSWVTTQQQFAAIQAQIDDAKHLMLTSHNTWLQHEHDINMEYAAAYDWMYYGAKGVQGVADTAVNILEKATGPGGKAIKKSYTFLKTFGGELAEKGVSGQTLLTATLKGTSDIAMDELGGKILPGFDFGDGPDLSDYDVGYIAKHLVSEGSWSSYLMQRHFTPGLLSTGQGEVQNYLGWRPMSDDAKKALGALSGDTGDAESLMNNPAFLERLLKMQLANRFDLIGGLP